MPGKIVERNIRSVTPLACVSYQPVPFAFGKNIFPRACLICVITRVSQDGNLAFKTCTSELFSKQFDFVRLLWFVDENVFTICFLS